MPRAYTEQIFQTTYKDDFKDSDNYHRILFNSGRALQARELTQMQTIIQREISRFAGNLFTDGAPIQPGGVMMNTSYEFIKIESTTPLPADLTTLTNVVFTGSTSGIRVRVYQAIASEGSDPETIYVQYLDVPSGLSGSEISRVQPGETISGIVGGNTVDLTVQAINTTANPAVGQGALFSIADGSFFVQGHFVFAPAQSIILSKYSRFPSATVGFRITQDIVTTADAETLFDNQGATPNRSSPGADRYRIRLELVDYNKLTNFDNFVYVSEVYAGKIVDRPTTSKGFKSIRDEMALQHFETNGDWIKKYFKAYFEPNGESTLLLRVEPGTAYVQGYRVEKNKTSNLVVPKATDTFTQDNEGISIDYGNFFEFDGGKGMLDFNSCELVNLRTAAAYGGTTMGTARVRAIREGTGSNYNLHIFNIDRTDPTKSLRDVKSIGTSVNNYVDLVLNASNQSVLKEPTKKTLLFDMPISRPKGMTSISLSGARKFTDTTDGAGSVTIALSAGGENFENTGDWIVASANNALLTGYTISLTGGATSATISGLPTATAVEVLTYVKKGTGKIRQKTLTETTVQTTLTIDGQEKYIELGQSDIYEVSRIQKWDSDGGSFNNPNLFGRFILDTGSRDTHYDDGRLYYKGSGLDSDGQQVFVRFKYFAHGSGDFFAVSSYNGQVNYRDIPAHRMENGALVSLRDVLDFRPSTNGSGAFTTVSELPQPTDLVEADTEYYLPRLDKLVLSKTGEMRYLQGTSALQPKFPATPENCIDLYKFELQPNTLHTKDLKTTMIPRRGYTMEDIGKLEKKIDKIEEMTTLSLLELATKNLAAFDSTGLDRTKAGFFVDNFATHKYSETKNPEYRASIDPRAKLVRPSFKEQNIDLFYDSDNAENSNVVMFGDNVYLAHTEVIHTAQDVASRTENLNPFFTPRTQGHITLSPASDFWKESQIAAPRIIDGGTELDTRQALLWNNWEWNWGGVDINDLQVGQSTSQVTGTSTATTTNVSEPRLTGVTVTEDPGPWVVTGTHSASDVISTQDVIVSSSTEEVDFVGDKTVDGDTTTWTEGTDTIQTTTTEQRSLVETVNTSTLSQTTTVSTEREYTTTTDYVTNTSTTTTVNRIASESTVREVIGTNVIDVAVIPFMRTRRISFKAEALRPNTQYFAFFDGVDVSMYCKAKAFVRKGAQAPETEVSYLEPAVEHEDGTSPLISNSNGRFDGEFLIPNNSAMRFRTGKKEFALLDISVYNMKDALSSAVAFYTAEGALETFQDTVRSTRVLEVVGTQNTTTNQSVRTTTSLSTDTVVTTNVATDVQTERTISEVIGAQTTTSEVVGTQTTIITEVAVPPEPTPDPDPTPVAPDPEVPVADPNDPVREDPTPNDDGIGDLTPDEWGKLINVNVEGEFQLWADPLAQSFLVEDVNGIFLTRVRCYFAEKDTAGLPCWIELRPMVNGHPHSTKVIPGSIVTLNNSQVKTVPTASIASMLANGTDFVFEEPIFLEGGREYALILRSSSMEYKVYISETEDFVLGSTERRISKQPYLGSLFKSQNSTTWEPAGKQDLAFRLYRAKFQNYGNAILENINVPRTIVGRNGLYVDSGSDTINVITRGHGMRQGDITTITGLDSATTYNGIPGAAILGQHAVTAVDGVGYQFKTTGNVVSTSAGRFGGGKVKASQNMLFDTIRPIIDTLNPEGTNITFSGKFTSASSLVDSDAGRYIKDASYTLLKNKRNQSFDNPKGVYTAIEEQAELINANLGRSATVQISMTTTDDRVSPVIDMQRAGLALISNQIDKQDSAATTGFNKPINWVSETNPQNGTHLAKHLTIPVTLDDEAVGLKIILAANKPPAADFLVYYRVADESQKIRKQNWVLVNAEANLPSDTNPNVFREYRYLVGGLNGTMDPFTQFQVKIVFRSSNSAKVPIIRDLRCIALTV